MLSGQKFNSCCFSTYGWIICAFSSIQILTKTQYLNNHTTSNHWINAHKYLNENVYWQLLAFNIYKLNGKAAFIHMENVVFFICIHDTSVGWKHYFVLY